MLTTSLKATDHQFKSTWGSVRIQKPVAPENVDQARHYHFFLNFRLSFQFALSAMEAPKMQCWAEIEVLKLLDLSKLPANNCLQPRKRAGPHQLTFRPLLFEETLY
jgi:hypothetical protein